MDGHEKKKSWLRIGSVVVGLGLVLAIVLAALNLSSSKANGAESSEPAAAQEDQQADGQQDSDSDSEGEGEEGKEKKAPVPVEVEQVAVGPVSDYIMSSANLVAEYQVKVLSEVEGRLSRVKVEEGDAVRSGQVMATLVRDDAEIGLTKAELRRTNARMAFERGEDLLAKELISREEHDKFTMEYELAKEELAEARWTLEKTTIRAPFGGVLSERLIQVGQHIRPGDELFQVTDTDPLIARIFLPERDVIGLDVGRDVKIRLNADENVEFSGRVRQISPVVDVATGTVKVTVEASGPPSSVRPGSFVGIHIVRETHPRALLVPREAVIRELQKAHVFVAGVETAERRIVTLGLEEDDLVEALSGLEEGDQVIVAGQGGLKDGSPIKILGAEAPVETETGADVGEPAS
ncbi:MAG: efflux RND transporter periplasmic adaptor subunit [Acidobacteriota bacterium]|nr:efflux RND transporter periplasmic adaptor subunit [Acidobacteriota bacterium]